MNCVVLYATSTGNTEKIALSIAKNLNINCIKLNENSTYDNLNLKNYDLVLLGSGIYGGTLHKNLINFINSINTTDKKTFSFFISWFGRGHSDKKAINRCKNVLLEKNQNVIDNYYECYGEGFLFIKKGHPSEQELHSAIQWAKEVINGQKKL
ncbi:flavodoxin domain-containing protein [Haloimpatiens sp. FM7330]|uniref:flavodoxin domain-containing protein n=1 Tax=Haloimpatiens sp. FM7330 TaxID=3298610 RepID=UPI00363ABDCD